MKKVYQTTFGGVDAPKEKQGNCWQACVASILEIPLEEAFDCRPYNQIDPKDRRKDRWKWFRDFNEWLKKYGLACIAMDHTKSKPLHSTPFLGYHIGEFKSVTLTNANCHVCVIRDGEVVHDPNPHAGKVGDALGIYLFVPLNPVEWK